MLFVFSHKTTCTTNDSTADPSDIIQFYIQLRDTGSEIFQDLVLQPISDDFAGVCGIVLCLCPLGGYLCLN